MSRVREPPCPLLYGFLVLPVLATVASERKFLFFLVSPFGFWSCE